MRKKILLSALILGIGLSTQALAKSVALDDLQDFSIDNVKISDKGKAFDSNHWAYKTLKNVSYKYGILVGKPEEALDGNKPISRNEAAIILVSLMGKIEDKNIKMNEADKAKIEILQQELNGEINRLSGRVDAVEKSVSEVQGKVANLEDQSKGTWHTAFGQDFKLTGGLQAGYTAVPVKGEENYSPNFGLPYSEIGISGKLHDHLDYTAQLVPTRNFSDTTFNGLLREAYVSTDIIPKHQLAIGQMTRPVGREALLSPLGIDFIDFSQASRKLLSNDPATYDPHNQDTGVKLSGNWDLIDYSVGTFNGSGNNSFDTNRKSSIAGQVNVKPFGKNTALGQLEMGSSLLYQNTNYTENLVGYHTSYTYKKFNIKGEYLAKSGFTQAGQKARGWFIDGKYNVTDKLILLARYDNFDPDIKASVDKSVEYVAGVNYLFTDNLGLLVNFVNVDNQSGRDGHRVGFLTQFMF